MNGRPTLVCVGCLKEPRELLEYVAAAQQTNDAGQRIYADADDYVWQEEGTMNRRNGHFLCDACYIAWGQPTHRDGWKAP